MHRVLRSALAFVGAGLPVTADVALYQLILTDEALIDFSNLYHVQPPLRTRADRDGLRAAVKSGVVSAISSHHQPHERDAKLAPFGATEPGISSVELLLPLAMTLVEEGLLDLPTLLARLSAGPAEALRLPAGKLAVGAAADVVLFDPASSTVAGEHWLSKGENCPFMGHSLPAGATPRPGRHSGVPAASASPANLLPPTSSPTATTVQHC